MVMTTMEDVSKLREEHEPQQPITVRDELIVGANAPSLKSVITIASNSSASSSANTSSSIKEFPSKSNNSSTTNINNNNNNNNNNNSNSFSMNATTEHQQHYTLNHHQHSSQHNQLHNQGATASSRELVDENSNHSTSSISKKASNLSLNHQHQQHHNHSSYSHGHGHGHSHGHGHQSSSSSSSTRQRSPASASIALDTSSSSSSKVQQLQLQQQKPQLRTRRALTPNQSPPLPPKRLLRNRDSKMSIFNSNKNTGGSGGNKKRNMRDNMPRSGPSGVAKRLGLGGGGGGRGGGRSVGGDRWGLSSGGVPGLSANSKMVQRRSKRQQFHKNDRLGGGGGGNMSGWISNNTGQMNGPSQGLRSNSGWRMNNRFNQGGGNSKSMNTRNKRASNQMLNSRGRRYPLRGNRGGCGEPPSLQSSSSMSMLHHRLHQSIAMNTRVRVPPQEDPGVMTPPGQTPGKTPSSEMGVYIGDDISDVASICSGGCPTGPNSTPKEEEQTKWMQKRMAKCKPLAPFNTTSFIMNDHNLTEPNYDEIHDSLVHTHRHHQRSRQRSESESAGTGGGGGTAPSAASASASASLIGSSVECPARVEGGEGGGGKTAMLMMMSCDDGRGINSDMSSSTNMNESSNKSTIYDPSRRGSGGSDEVKLKMVSGGESCGTKTLTTSTTSSATSTTMKSAGVEGSGKDKDNEENEDSLEEMDERMASGDAGAASSQMMSGDDEDEEEFYSSPEDGAEYLQEQFTNMYEETHAERLNSMSKNELVKEFLSLQGRIDELERKLKETERSRRSDPQQSSHAASQFIQHSTPEPMAAE